MKRLEIPLGAGEGLSLMRSLARLRFRSLTAFACGMVRANRHEHSNVGGSANAFGAGGMVHANQRKHSNVGDSARSLRSLAEWCTPPEEGEGKRWAARGVAPLKETASSPPIFSLFPPVRGAPFRETHQRRAEPPTNTTPFPFLPCVRCTIPRDATASSGTSNEQPLLL